MKTFQKSNKKKRFWEISLEALWQDLTLSLPRTQTRNKDADSALILLAQKKGILSSSEKVSLKSSAAGQQ